MVCPRCNTENSMYSFYCRKCGLKFHLYTCPQCGFSNLSDSIFCESCGERFKVVLRDADGITYKTIQIGNQLWTSENLRCRHTIDRRMIKTLEKYYENDNDAEPHFYRVGPLKYCPIEYGSAYSWEAAMQSIPNGWKIPTLEDWRQLIKHCITFYGGEAKTIASKTGWYTPALPIDLYIAAADKYGENPFNKSVGDNLDENNVSGFNAFPAGFADNENGVQDIGLCTRFWTSSEDENDRERAYYIELNTDFKFITEGCMDKNNACYVRCIQIKESK